MQWINENRIVHIGGSFGSGKTALAFELAYYFWKNYPYRYIFTNIQSVWNDDPSEVVLRDGKFVDAIIIIDEAGVFLKKKSHWDEWDFALRKLNVILLAPSVKKLPVNDEVLYVERSMNLKRGLIPAWRYGVYLKSRSGEDVVNFNWVKPDEIFGIYSTDDTPLDAKEISAYLKSWLAEREENLGNEDRAIEFTKQSIGTGFISRKFVTPPDSEQE